VRINVHRFEGFEGFEAFKGFGRLMVVGG